MKIDLMQLEFIDLKLRNLATEVEDRFGEKVVTSLYRIDDSGVHGTLPLRGIDLRCSTSRHGRAVEDWVNSRWLYDKDRLEKNCCKFHSNRSNNGYHIHLQVHENTKEI